MRTESQSGQPIKQDEEVVLVYAIVRREDYNKVLIPPGSFAKAMEIGPASDLCDMANCKGWGGIVGIALSRVAKKNFPEIFALMNPPPSSLQLVPPQES
jgi:hypothetical protein